MASSRHPSCGHAFAAAGIDYNRTSRPREYWVVQGWCAQTCGHAANDGFTVGLRSLCTHERRDSTRVSGAGMRLREKNKIASGG